MRQALRTLTHPWAEFYSVLTSRNQTPPHQIMEKPAGFLEAAPLSSRPAFGHPESAIVIQNDFNVVLKIDQVMLWLRRVEKYLVTDHPHPTPEESGIPQNISADSR